MRTIFTQLTHSIRQKTTESRRNRRMAQKGYECFWSIASQGILLSCAIDVPEGPKTKPTFVPGA